MSRAVVSRLNRPISAEFSLPGDKSISHRRALLSLFLNETIRLENYSTGEDCLTTLSCLKSLGKEVSRTNARVTISGEADAIEAVLDCGNSGTTSRLLMGVLAGLPGSWRLTGDESLSRRPMQRVATPLQLMGGELYLSDGKLPAVIEGRPLHGVKYESPVASAQVKSAILLAALSAKGVTAFKEPLNTRDHTERLLNLSVDGEGWLRLDPESIHIHEEQLSGEIPGDPSTATFWCVACLCVPGSTVVLNKTLSNPRRIAHYAALSQAGANVKFDPLGQMCGEPVGRLTAEHGPFAPLTVGKAAAAEMIDEIPALAVLATQLEGTSRFVGLSELRVKESDRLRLIADGLTAMGAQVTVDADNLAVSGPCRLQGATIETARDHRIAMAFAIAGLLATGETVIEHAECVAVSYPDFWSEFSRVAPECVVHRD